MSALVKEWPDEDRRDDALLRCLIDVHEMEPTTDLTPHQKRTLEVVSHGMTNNETAEILGVTLESVKQQLKLITRALRAKNKTHACCIALRNGLIK